MHMLFVSGMHAGCGPQSQSGISLEHAQSLVAHGTAQAWHTMPSAHCASLVHAAGVHALISIGSHGSLGG